MRLTQTQEDLADDDVEKFLKKPRSAGEDEALTVRNAEWRAGNILKSPSERQHSKRSQRAQTVDENHNAPLPDTYGQWARNPDRYDLPGVDTIPKEKEEKRAERFAEQQKERGVIDQITTAETGEVADTPQANFANGAFDPRENEIRMREGISDDKRPFTLAHEAGHAADAATTEGFGTSKNYTFREMFEDPEREQEVEEGLNTLSERARGGFEERDGYRDNANEKLADALALTALEPRAAKREAPEVVDFFEEQGFL